MSAFSLLPLELIALAALLLGVLLGWLSPEQALAGFGNPATITVVAMFVLSTAVVRTGALIPVEAFLMRFGGQDLRRQLLFLGLVVCPLSAVISNTAVVALFIPVVERWSRRLGVSPARMLMPLSFMTVMAGVVTLLGTSTNLVASSISDQLGYGSFTLLQFTPIALVTYGIGMLVLLICSPWLLPQRPVTLNPEELVDDYDITDYLSELRVTAQSPLLGRRIDDTLLQHIFDVRILALVRDDERFSLPLGDQQLRSGDLLLVKGRQEQLIALDQKEGLTLVAQTSDGLTTNSTADAVVEVLIPAESRLISQKLRDTRFAQRFNATVLAIRRRECLLRDRLGQVSLQLGDALLLQIPNASVPGLQVSGDLLLLDDAPDSKEGQQRMAWAVGSLVLMLVLSLWRSDLLVIWALLAVILCVASRALTPQELYSAVRWDVVVLLAALLPLASLVNGTGAANWIVLRAANTVGGYPPYVVLVTLYGCTALVTELVSNQAAVSLMLPLGLSLAHQLAIPPAAAMAVMVFAASNSFLTPIGYQTNTMVYSVGGYRFRDFLKLGLPLTIALALLTPAAALMQEQVQAFLTT
jgi:di/tricarboxylate transporter